MFMSFASMLCPNDFDKIAYTEFKGRKPIFSFDGYLQVQFRPSYL